MMARIGAWPSAGPAVFSASSVVEGLGAALINGYQSGNYGSAAAQIASQVISKAAGLEVAANETASQISD
jgi:hypothetical protein